MLHVYLALSVTKALYKCMAKQGMCPGSPILLKLTFAFIHSKQVMSSTASILPDVYASCAIVSCAAINKVRSSHLEGKYYA